MWWLWLKTLGISTQNSQKFNNTQGKPSVNHTADVAFRDSIVWIKCASYLPSRLARSNSRGCRSTTCMQFNQRETVIGTCGNSISVLIKHFFLVATTTQHRIFRVLVAKSTSDFFNSESLLMHIKLIFPNGWRTFPDQPFAFHETKISQWIKRKK